MQNLTKLLANVTLKFLSWNMANILIFFAENMLVAFALLTFLQQINQCVENFLATTVSEFVINEFVKLTMLLTCGLDWFCGSSLNLHLR